MPSAIATPSHRAHPALRFDAFFLFALPALALVAGALAWMRPSIVYAIFAVDLWLFSFPHVASTFTRIAFSRRAVREHRVLLFAVPFAALGLASGLVHVGGIAALNTTYFAWQSFHYTRQSYGIDRALGHRAGIRTDRLGSAVIYLSSLAGVLVRCAEAPGSFLGSPLWLPTIPPFVAVSVGAVAGACLVAWSVRAVSSLAREPSDARFDRTLYVLLHVAMFTLGYVVIRDLTIGWLVVNVWHNTQYLGFVWSQNRRSYEGGVDRDAPAFAWIAAPGRSVRFLAACGALATVLFGVIFVTTHRTGTNPTPFLVLIQAVNFHHYIVDAVIWRRRGTR